jgi:hypothetical protein
LVGPYCRRIKTRIAIEIVRDASNGQAGAYARTRSQYVQVTRHRISVWIDKLRINRDAVRVLAGGRLPVCERCFDRAVEHSNYTIGRRGIQIVEVASQSWWIRCCAANGNCNVGDASCGIAARIPKNVVLEIARVAHDVAVKGKGIRRGDNTRATDIHTIEIVVGGRAGDVPNTGDLEAGGNRVTRRIQPEPNHVILESSRTLATHHHPPNLVGG